MKERELKQVLDLSIRATKELDTPLLKECEFSETQIGNVQFCARIVGSQVIVDSSVRCGGLLFKIGVGKASLVSEAVATCIMHMQGQKGQHSLQSIQAMIDEEKEKALEFSMFCETLGHDN